VVHFVLAAMGMRALALHFGISRAASLVVAVGFACSGPVLGMLDLWHHFAGACLMPWVVLALLFAAFYARMVRGSLLEAFGQDWMRTARAKGLSERKVVYKHALRASLTPVVSLFGADLGTLLGGAIITETVFNLPGLGTYVVRSVQNGDLPVIMDVVVFASLAVALMSLVADILYAFLDPRVRFS